MNEGLLLWRRTEEILQMLPDLIRNFHQNRTYIFGSGGMLCHGTRYLCPFQSRLQ